MAHTKNLLKKIRLSMESVIERVKGIAISLPDSRKKSPNKKYAVSDSVLSAFSVFFLQFPSFLSYQQKMEEETGRNNARSLFGVHAIPSDNQIRKTLDPIAPEAFFPALYEIGDRLKEEGYLEQYRTSLGFLIPIDGTMTFSSEKISCPFCTNSTHQNGTVSHRHSAVTPILVVPGQSRVIALPPEFVTPQDGDKKQDCEIKAATRWLDRHGSHYAPWGATLLGDDLYSREPFCRRALDAGFHYLFVCKPSSHKTLYKSVGDLATRLVCYRTEGKRKIHFEIDTYRFMNNVPLKDGKNALRGNWFELVTTDKLTGEVLFHGSWVTSHRVTQENIADMAVCARARWKVENENNNVLKTKGYNLDHNFGHGEKNLSNTLATLNIFSFLLHTALEFFDERYRLLRSRTTRQDFFNELKVLTKRFFFKDWDHLMAFMAGESPPADSG